MKTFFDWAQLLISAVTAIAATAATVNAARAQRERASVGSRSERANGRSESMANADKWPAAKVAAIGKRDAFIALGSIWLGLLGLAMLQFGPERAAPLSTGDAASIAVSFALLLLGGWLLFRR